MKKKVRKDKNIRQNVFLYETQKFILFYSSNSSLLVNNVRINLCKKMSSLPKNAQLTRCVSRCTVTGRRKRINKWFSFSRLVLLRFFRSGFISQWRKSKW